ncbi:hypothetical protein [Atopococcus tabaci]|uniref:hypothetical protein n=1 Tax=Atopococcus tabaci TaxID=269774 RepID=UPI0004046E30|nr:hypothetical protein [Atopococcus tabaci]
MYVRSITFPTQESEFDFFINIKRTVYDSFTRFRFYRNADLSGLILNRSPFYTAETGRERRPH